MAAASVFQRILDPDARPDPYPLYAQLRRTPVTREEDGTFVVSTYQEIVALLHDPRVSSDPRNFHRGGGDTTPPEEVMPGQQPSFIVLDPPDHDRLRRLAAHTFGPPRRPDRIDGLRPRLAAIVTELIDRFPDSGRLDIVDDFAYPFPVSVICELLGVPSEDEPRFRPWAEALVAELGPPGAPGADQAQVRRREVVAEVDRYLADLLDGRIRQPGDDLLSGMSSAADLGGPMTRKDVLATARLLLIAGHETTVNLIANGMLTLLRHPTVLSRLRQEPDLGPRVIEELLRFEPPVHILPWRVALDDIPIAGTTIPAGKPITLVLAAGSRDPAHLPDPDRFDPDRRYNEHLGFGGGIHYCFGAPLARLEAEIALTELARRLEHPRLVTDPPPYRPSPVLRGPRHLLLDVERVVSPEAARAMVGVDAVPS
jgi:cytochrome P450